MTSSASSPQDLEKGVNTLENIETLPQQGSIAGVSQGFPNIQEIYSDRDFITLGSSTYRRRDLLNALDRGDGEEGNCAKYTPHQFANPVPVSYTHLDVYKRQVFSCNLDDLLFTNASRNGIKLE